MQTKRSSPLSPHLTIYKPQITSVLSIMHRITGVILFAGLMLFLWWIVVNVYYRNDELSALNNIMTSKFGMIIIFMWSYCLFFHACNGVRHLLWDAGIGFEKKSVIYSGWMVVIVSFLLTVSSWFAAL